VQLDDKYSVKVITNGTQKIYTRKQLHEGLPVELKAGREQLLMVVQ
jgi:hypothetical protein